MPESSSANDQLHIASSNCGIDINKIKYPEKIITNFDAEFDKLSDAAKYYNMNIIPEAFLECSKSGNNLATCIL
jgi:hypothetical protein